MLPIERLFAFLSERSNQGRLATYTEAGQVVSLEPGSYVLWGLLGQISEITMTSHGCMLSAIVISDGVESNHRGSPGNEFYDLANQIGRGSEVKKLGRLAFWAKEVRVVHETRWA